VYEKLTHDSTTNWKDMPALDPLNVKEQRVEMECIATKMHAEFLAKVTFFNLCSK
jgi:hypothetical protein